MKNNRIIFILLISFLLSAPLSASEKLGKYNTSWSNVIPGKVITEPVLTSYGFCVVTDGRTLSAFTNKGKLLWEKQTQSSKNVKISSLPEDFIILYDNDRNNFKIFNPSGTMLWEKDIDFEIINSPLPGRDGRFFITGKNIVQCYGINGICKWSVETENQKNIKPKELPDGSIIVFLEEKDGKTKSLRFSPFGKIMEEITFSGEVTNAYTTQNGVFLSFTDGSSGLFSLENNKSKNKWVLGIKTDNSFLVSSGKDYIFLDLYEDRIIANKILYEDGTITSQFTINNINGLDLKLAKLTKKYLFIADSKNCYIYNIDGTINWDAIMLENKGTTKWNYVIYTNDNHLVFCLENWSINGYLTSQNMYNYHFINQADYGAFLEIDPSPYKSPYSDEINRSVVNQERAYILKNGYYGEKEQVITSDLYSICTAYLEMNSKVYSHKTLSVFDKDAYGTEIAFRQLSLLGTSESSSYIAKLIANTNNKFYLNVIASSIVNCGYDPQGKILKQLEIATGKLNKSDTILAKSICDAVYSICYFMGKPALFLRGKGILKQFFLPQYNIEVRDYAKTTLMKINDFESR